MAIAELDELTLGISDVSGEKQINLSGVRTDGSVGDLVQGLLTTMELPRKDVEGRPMTYYARLEREGRHLHATEIVGDSLQQDDRLVLQPHISAGGI